MRSLQQRAPSGTGDFTSAIHRSHVLNHVVLAEINFFQQEKVTDLNAYMKTFVDEQIQFYEKVAQPFYRSTTSASTRFRSLVNYVKLLSLSNSHCYT
jgi:hypothetical protein